jgi:alpha-L-arabinofuranosidase
VFKKYRESLLGESLAVEVQSPTTTPPAPQLEGLGFRPGDVERPRETPWLDAAATRRADGSIALALVNRHPDHAVEVVVEGAGAAAIRDVWTWHSADILAVNDLDTPGRILPRVESVADVPAVRSWTCPPHSLVVLTLRAGE